MALSNPAYKAGGASGCEDQRSLVSYQPNQPRMRISMWQDDCFTQELLRLRRRFWSTSSQRCAQYAILMCRCHPSISRVPNTLFYDGQLVDGCTPAQRPALAPGLAPVCFLETQGGYQQYQKGSSSASNKAEAHAIVQVRWELYDSCIVL